jgi:CDP-paratose 2-epimerase
MSTHVLITGGAGFLGSAIGEGLRKSHSSWKITAFDNLSRRGGEHNLQRFDEIGIQFVHGDIRNPEDLDGIGNFDVMIDASANPSVIVGIDSSPLQALNTNLWGTINCLEACVRTNASLLFLSTSRVYPFGLIDSANFDELDTRFAFTDMQQLQGVSSVGISEQFPLSGARSFYGAAKLASELLVTEYREFKKLKAIINRCGIIAGPGQFGKVDQGIVTYWMACHLLKKDLSYIGYGGMGKQVRDLIHVHDLVRLIDLQIQNIDLFDGKTMNVGGGLERSLSLIELTKFCQEITGNTVHIGSVEETRAADVRIYLSDNKQLESICAMKWQMEMTTKDILGDSYSWVRQNENLFKRLIL